MKYVTSLTASEAKEFFLRQQSYCSFDVPEYFVFEEMLKILDRVTEGRSISDYYVDDREVRPKKLKGVNHVLVSNKDGKYAWRPLQLIHPALYLELVNVVTQEDNWSYIVKKFNNSKTTCKSIFCSSLPVVTDRYVNDKSEQISSWSTHVEKESVVAALEYEFLFHTDITDCYGSMYTHTVSWALHGIEEAKADRGNDRNRVGNRIDETLQSMSSGQTNGIPQGSSLMDFVAEIVLAYIDILLHSKLVNKKVKQKDYKIIRYRDDYRIFTNNPQLGEMIAKELSDVLHIFGLKINASKTINSSDVVHSSIKPDKLHSLSNPKKFETLTPELYSISLFAKEFPNSGQLLTQLSSFYKKLEKIEKESLKEHVGVLISVTVDIACKNPRCYPLAAAILSKLLYSLPKSERRRYVSKIRNKFDRVPNTNIMQLWLQRMKADFTWSEEYIEPLCKVVLGESTRIWNSDWLTGDIRSLIEGAVIVDRQKLQEMPHVISLSEVNLFITSYDN